jgi:hypothetical protein
MSLENSVTNLQKLTEFELKKLNYFISQESAKIISSFQEFFEVEEEPVLDNVIYLNFYPTVEVEVVEEDLFSWY